MTDSHPLPQTPAPAGRRENLLSLLESLNAQLQGIEKTLEIIKDEGNALEYDHSQWSDDRVARENIFFACRSFWLCVDAIRHARFLFAGELPRGKE